MLENNLLLRSIYFCFINNFCWMKWVTFGWRNSYILTKKVFPRLEKNYFILILILIQVKTFWLFLINWESVKTFHVDYRKCSVLHVEITENENPQTTLYCIWHNSWIVWIGCWNTNILIYIIIVLYSVLFNFVM